jgi:Fur family ferric uptake transcriptional regulator
MRNTRQSATLRSILAAHPAPLSVHEILSLAQRRHPGLGIATVYRHVSHWLEEGWLTPVELPGQPCRYELAGKAHHHHFLCSACGRVFDLPGCVPGLHQLLPEGFHAQRHDVTIYGACRRCAATLPIPEREPQHA